MMNTTVLKKQLTFKEKYAGTIYAENILNPRHKPVYSAEFPKSKKPSVLERFANVDDILLKRAPLNSLEGMANKLLLESERMEQAIARICPPVTDRAYVKKADFSVMDLYNDIVSCMEWTAICYLIRCSVFGFSAISTYSSVLDWEYYRAERKKWRKCRNKYCLNMFALKGDNIREQSPKRSDSRYCCDGCRGAADEAEERYKLHGSYLPVYFYVGQLTDTVGDKIRKREVAKTSDAIDKQHAKRKATSPVVLPKEKVYEGGKVLEYKTLEDAKKAYEMAGNSGRIRI